MHTKGGQGEGEDGDEGEVEGGGEEVVGREGEVGIVEGTEGDLFGCGFPGCSSILGPLPLLLTPPLPLPSPLPLPLPRSLVVEGAAGVIPLLLELGWFGEACCGWKRLAQDIL